MSTFYICFKKVRKTEYTVLFLIGNLEGKA